MELGYSLLSLAPGHVGGSESYAAALLSELGRTESPEAVTVLANTDVERAYRHLERERIRFEVSRWYRPGKGGPARMAGLVAGLAAPRLVPRAVAGRLDVVHYPLTVPIPRLRAPGVVTLHDLQHHELPHLFSAAERAFRARTYDATARRAARVITPTEHSKQQLVNHLAVPPDRITVAPHGVDHGLFSPADTGAPVEVELPARFLFYPANMWPHKNHVRLLEAFERRADREVKLVLSGRTGPEADRLPPDVTHVGHLPLAQLPSVYRKAMALIFPSLFEGFGFPVLEAMACGCPVAAASIPAVAEVAGSAAQLFDPLDTAAITEAVDRIADDDALRERLGAAGPPRASDFTWERSAQRHREAYRAAADSTA